MEKLFVEHTAKTYFKDHNYLGMRFFRCSLVGIADTVNTNSQTLIRDRIDTCTPCEQILLSVHTSSFVNSDQ